VAAGDFLQTEMAALVAQARAIAPRAESAAEVPPVRVIGNLPYNVASPILFKLLKDADEGRTIADATLMLQKEVADRLVATPGSRTYGTLAVQVARVAAVERLLTLPPGAFRPPPKVTSAVVRLVFRPAMVDVGDAAVFERVVRGVFLQRRKTLLNALGPVAASFGRHAPDVIARAGVAPHLRPEDLALADFARLSRAVL
jgi:16S rRNA (adenine1518-N6/adenine1519-N6)-dimethyltransferase